MSLSSSFQLRESVIAMIASAELYSLKETLAFMWTTKANCDSARAHQAKKKKTQQVIEQFNVHTLWNQRFLEELRHLE